MRCRFRAPAIGGARGRRRRLSSRGSSDVVGTILLLAITVTLFGAVFFFVNAFPRPPSQSNSQFSATLSYGGASGRQITQASITHLAGPTLYSSQTQIYIASQAHPTALASKNPFTISSGLAGATAWSVGQVWSVPLSNLTIPDNLTITVVSSGQLLFRNVLPGSNPNIPPQFVNQGTTPANPAVGQSFTIYAQIVDDDLNTHSVYVNVSQLPGVPGEPTSFPMTYSASTGTWQYVVGAGVTNAAGSFFVFVNATDLAKQPNSVVIPVTIGVGSSGSSGGGPVQVQLALNQSAPVSGAATGLVATVTDSTAVGGSLTVTFQAAGVAVGTASGSVGPGSTISVTQSWTPSIIGTTLLSATANVTGVGSGSAAFNVTVFPKILLLTHNVQAGSNGPANESAFLATELSAAGVPFTQSFVDCKNALPAASTLQAYKVVIVDFGSGSASGCPASPTSGDQSNIVTASSSTNFWIVGANAWSQACGSYSSSYLGLFGISTSGRCMQTVAAPVSGVTYTAAPSQGLLGNGVPSSITIQKTLEGNSTYPSVNFGKSVTNVYLSSGATPVGSWKVNGAQRDAALGTDPALLSAQLPSGNYRGTGAAGAAVAYNVVDWLSGLSTSSSTGRAAVDFAVAQATLWGTNHSAPSTLYVALRANGLAGGAVTVALYVNGAEAFYQGSAVLATTTLPGSGGWAFVTLTWQAPSSGDYTLSVALLSAPGDSVSANNQLPVGLDISPSVAPGAPIAFG
jgi:hypothetical protein